MRSSNDKWDIPFQPTSKKRQAAVYLLEAAEAGESVSREGIAEHANLPKSTVTEVVNDLIKAGWTINRETDAYRRAWYTVSTAGRTAPGRPIPARLKDAPGETSGAEGALLTLPVADEAPPVKFSGFANGEIELTWEDAPGVLFRGTVGESVPGALLAGNSRVEHVAVHPSGAVVLDLGFMQVRGTMR